MKPIVQISLDIVDLDEALRTAEMALAAGVDWLEAGTPMILSTGTAGVRALRDRFPDTPIVADAKIMDGGFLEAKLMAEAGATHVVVMGRAHDETIEVVVKAGRDYGVKVMGDDMGALDRVAECRRLQDLGCDYIVHHIGYDYRRVLAAKGGHPATPLDQLREIVQAVNIPVQAVGGLTIEQAIRTPEYGAPLVVLGAPLTISADSFQTAKGDVAGALREICERVHTYGDVQITGAK